MMTEEIKYYDRFSNETIYLWNDDVGCFIKSDPKEGYFMKVKGKEEKPIAANSNTVVNAIHAKKEVTEKEYESGSKEITVTRSTESVTSEPEQRLRAMINGEQPRNEDERIMQAQIEEMMKKGVIIDIPEV